MMQGYPQMSRSEILYELPMMQGWPLLLSAQLANPYCDREIDGGYVHQERQRLRRAG